jgi:hypothetical protein
MQDNRLMMPHHYSYLITGDYYNWKLTHTDFH